MVERLLSGYALVLLLKYLEKKYFRELEVFDEGNYWNTMDKAVLAQRFGQYRTLLDTVAAALRQGTFIKTDDVQGLVDQIERVLRERLGEGD